MSAGARREVSRMTAAAITHERDRTRGPARRRLAASRRIAERSAPLGATGVAAWR